jgi:hypothetical protein
VRKVLGKPELSGAILLRDLELVMGNFMHEDTEYAKVHPAEPHNLHSEDRHQEGV